MQSVSSGCTALLQDCVGLMAINDSLWLESVIYEILKKFIRQESYYLPVVELFQEVSCISNMHQELICCPYLLHCASVTELCTSPGFYLGMSFGGEDGKGEVRPRQGSGTFPPGKC